MNRKLLALFGIAALVVLAAAWASPWSSRDAQASDWNPFFGPVDFYRLDPSTPGAFGDTHAQFNDFAPSANFTALFGGAITFGDGDVFTASAADIPGTGAYMGQLDSVATLGLINSGCNNDIAVTFNFVDANVALTPPGSALAMTPNVTLTAGINDTVTTFTYTSTGDPIGPPTLNPGAFKAEIEIGTEQMQVTAINTGTNTYTTVIRGWNGTTPAAHVAGDQIRKVNVIFPSGPSSNLLANLAEDDGDLDNNGTVEFPSFANSVADGADAIPSFVRDQADPNGTADDGGYSTPHARYAGVAFVANTLIVTLQFVLFAPGQLTAFPNLQWATTAYGYSSVTILQDPVAPPSTSNITDFCNFSSQTDFFGLPHDNLCTDTIAPPGACQTIGAGFTVRLAVDNGCPQFAPGTNPNECGLAGQANGICAARTCPRSTNPGAETGCLQALPGQCVGGPQCGNATDDEDTDTGTTGIQHDGVVNDGCPQAGAAAEAGGACADAVDSDGDGFVNDGCPTVGGVQRVRYYQYSVSQRDYDNDGHENALDTCPYNPDASWNPREANGPPPNPTDGDADGINGPGAGLCDPTNNPGDNDEDNDAWVNRLDGCPTLADADVGGGGGTVPNTFQFDQDWRLGAPFPAGQTDNDVPDGGPRSDSIGPACDVAANNCAGCPGNLDPNGPNGHYHATAAQSTICIGATTTACSDTADDDSDGVVNARDTCLAAPNPPFLYPDGPAANDPGRGNLSAATVVGANFIRVGATEADTLGFTTGNGIIIGLNLLPPPAGTRETLRYITSLNIDPVTFLPDPGRINFDNLAGPPIYNQDATFAHGIGEVVAQIEFAQYLLDTNNSGFTDSGDKADLTSVFGSEGGNPDKDGVSDPGPIFGVPGYQARLDNSGALAGQPDRFVDTSDIAPFTSNFGLACGPPFLP